MLTQQQVEAIPRELRILPQWVGAQNKVPLVAGTTDKASVAHPATWGTFEAALKGLADGEYTHIGFVFTEKDPYVFIDLDCAKDPITKKPLPENDDRYINRDQKNRSWVKAFNSYAEISASGKGYHIIIRAKLGQAVKKDGVELYSTGRYAIFTGDSICLSTVEDRQEQLDQVVSALRLQSHAPAQPIRTQTEVPDDSILDAIARAANADGIRRLWEGDWEGSHPSQSEADMALLAHLCFYTKDDEQAARLFRLSALGQRAKANNPRDPYVESSIQRIRQSAPPQVDFTKFKAAVKEIKQKAKADESKAEPKPIIKGYPRPPGVLGEVADFILGAAIRPVAEIAYAGAIAFAAGITGRHYNISDTGLNLYILLLAGTGVGKEAAADGIDKLYYAIRPIIPDVETFRGPANFASGTGLVRAMGEKTMPCALSVIGEFGIRLSAMSDPRANGAEMSLKSALLEFFSKSGETKTLSVTAYADSQKNTESLVAPALSILGVTTQDTFFSKLTESAVTEGLIPRFMAIAVDAEPQVNSKTRLKVPAPALINKLVKVVESVLYMSRNGAYTLVEQSKAAEDLFDKFELDVIGRMKAQPEGAIREILNRVHLKALRLAAIAAVLDQHDKPMVEDHHARWAIEFVDADSTYMMSKFEKNEVGQGDNRQIATMRAKIRDLTTGGARSKDEKWNAMLAQGVVPYSLLSQRVINLAVFANDTRRGPTNAIKAALSHLVDTGEVEELSPKQTSERFGVGGKSYGVAGLRD